MPDGSPVELVDLPGAYGLDPTSPDEEVTRDVLLGKQKGERLPNALLIVVDASNLDNHLRFALQLIDLGLPTVVALNMIDLAKRDGLELDAARLEEELGVPVVETVAVRKRGMADIMEQLQALLLQPRKVRAGEGPTHDLLPLQRRAREIAMGAIVRETPVRRITHQLDGVLLHPIAGPDHSCRDPVPDVPGGLLLVGGSGRRAGSGDAPAWAGDRQRASRQAGFDR